MLARSEVGEGSSGQEHRGQIIVRSWDSILRVMRGSVTTERF